VSPEKKKRKGRKKGVSLSVEKAQAVGWFIQNKAQLNVLIWFGLCLWPV
jgi:hypothetical protein